MASSESFQHSEDLRQCITGILDGSERLTRLIQNFLMLAELESGLGISFFEHRRTVIEDLNGLLGEVVDSYRGKAEQLGVNIELDITGTLPLIYGDYAYLVAALVQLVDNAVRFSPPHTGAVVTITVGVQDGYISIQVRDRGPGISLEEQKRLFDIFYQVNREKLEQGGGGAGLTIVQHVAHLHGGAVDLESEPGCGSCFELRLPVMSGEEQDRSVPDVGKS
jgi:signal transduction histidine kinase